MADQQVKPEANAGAGPDASQQSQQSHHSQQGPKYSAPKDKSCSYCGQAFTSSSLGRHLDLYIKPKNPKAPDGIHDVDEIRKLRGNITRRQARGSLPACGTANARGGSISPTTDASHAGTPAATPQPGSVPSRRETHRESDSAAADSSSVASAPPNGIALLPFSLDTATAAKYPYTPKWDGTSTTSQEDSQDPLAAAGATSKKRPSVGSRTLSKQVVAKTQFEAKSRVTDAMDTARAAELALRELLGSWRAAKKHVDLNSMPFVDCSPLALDFPALTLQYLQPPPTLFASTLAPSVGAWSTVPPGQHEFISLQAFFKEKFSKWKAACLRSKRATLEELTRPSSRQDAAADTHEAVRLAEEQADAMEIQVLEHVNEAYGAWIQRALQDRAEIWVLELARGVGRARKEIDKLKEERHRLAQENANLKTQIDNLNRLQQPREFRMQTPGTLPLDRELVSQVLESDPLDGGLAGEDRHMDLNAAVTKMIERWKPVVAATRAASSGMMAQRSLVEQTQQHQLQQQAPEVVMMNTPVTMAGSGCPTPSRSHPHPHPHPHPQPSTPVDQSTAANAIPAAGPSDAHTTPPSISEGASTIDDASDVEIDGDGDVEVSGEPSVDTSMEDDAYPVMHQAPPTTMSPAKQTLGSNVLPPQQQQPVDMDLSNQHNNHNHSHNLAHVHSHNPNPNLTHAHAHTHNLSLNHNQHHNHTHTHTHAHPRAHNHQNQLDHQMQQQIQQMQSQMQAHASSVAAAMQHNPDLGIPMEATQLFMANQKAAQAAHMSNMSNMGNMGNMARSMPAMAAALQTPLHSAAGLGLPIQDTEGMYME